ncbi:MAG: hypothetical protein JSS67_06270 [Bacteroidetes bacterium]|nr:hypothetical protein [Bacteroidota bacterium]
MPYNEQLPDFILADLYKNVFIFPGKSHETHPSRTEKPASPVDSKKPDKDIQILGKNLKNILIIVKENSEEIIRGERKSVLLKILAACNLVIDDVAIMNMSKKITSFEEIKLSFIPEKVLLFDISTKDIGLPFIIPHYQVQHFDHCIFLSAPGILLDKDEGDENIKAEKLKLWSALKKIFFET